MQHLTSKESDEEAKMEVGNDVESSKEMDVEAEDGFSGQVTGHQFKKKESGEKDEVETAKKNKCQEHGSG